MVVLQTQSEFGYAPPPQTPYSVISNLPGWKVAEAFRDGDRSALANVVHIYPRLIPTHASAQLGREIAKHVGLEGHATLVYLNPVVWEYTRRHVSSKQRGKHRIDADDIVLKCVDVGGHRVFAILFAPQKMPALILTWGNPGLGISIRGSEVLLKDVENMKEVTAVANGIRGDAGLPQPSWTPEGAAHQGLRNRICELLHRAPIDPDKVKCQSSDVYLYPTGMAAIFHPTSLMMKLRPGTVVVLGVVFHNTYHHLIEECPHGWKHFGTVDEAGLDSMEEWLEGEKQANRTVSYVLVEIPGNPTLDSPDMYRLKKLSDKYDFVLIVDDTVGGFGNVDVLPLSSMLTTSLTKSFSGQANVMGGSIVLNPLSPHYGMLKPAFQESHHNELFVEDAEVLLSNSQDFLQRTVTLNRNAQVMADFLHKSASLPNSPIQRVQYPTCLPSKANYDAVLRPSTSDLPHPGYGCLLNVEFTCLETAIAFYNRCGFYPSPHLGGHVTIMLPYSLMIFGKTNEEKEYMASLGAKPESIRISAGLENEEDLVDTLKDALEVATAAVKRSESK